MTSLALCLSTLLGCFIGSFVPIVNTELVVLAAAAAAPPALIIPLILIASITQMVAKSLLYYAGSGLLRLPAGRLSRHIETAVRRVQERQGASRALLFASASTGFPPFYVMSVASGALHVDFRQFFMIGLAGRTLRFAAIVIVPQIIKSLI